MTGGYVGGEPVAEGFIAFAYGLKLLDNSHEPVGLLCTCAGLGHTHALEPSNNVRINKTG